MQLKPFLLDAWLDQYEHDIEFNLAASTGPTRTMKHDIDFWVTSLCTAVLRAPMVCARRLQKWRAFRLILSKL